MTNSDLTPDPPRNPALRFAEEPDVEAAVDALHTKIKTTLGLPPLGAAPLEDAESKRVEGGYLIVKLLTHRERFEERVLALIEKLLEARDL